MSAIDSNLAVCRSPLTGLTFGKVQYSLYVRMIFQIECFLPYIPQVEEAK